ncbi:hypothetical protein B7R74_07330 [Yersinia pseudotuberculosis]|uniref:Uncharacterized protein n=3 Tax=Yersinia pseudotuberculosis complex TaxID=1649845 RepID=A0A0T9RIW8_9GAMM|nr:MULTISPECIES: hypothetical protein [Yersinia pseudotuberculosis complex]AIN15255.1 hypothetical protein DJ40_3658 [Yersinia pseudotuberculosis]AJJ06782.1 hypothetical protein BZ20_3323 [Yersinia pseudotuberculosis]AJJ58140.1 hypothetical protein BZ22_1824 [Yersinia pseudotuberculosis YPIII]AXY33932.1 hypothetical protein CEQ20_11230 [Yersinia pseudotuberculosis]AYW87289.1 hypothetical protein EGX87_08880 [Yersinia pseudotuberculosis]
MATLARRLFKTLLFVGLLLLSIRYVHTYPVPMPADQLALLFTLSEKLGIRDPDDLYIPVMMIVDLIAAIIAYVLIMKLWHLFDAKRKSATPK